MFTDTAASSLEPIPAAASTPDLPWIETRPGSPYFVTDQGEPWTPIGQNDSLAWVELTPLFRRKDPAAVERHLDLDIAHRRTPRTDCGYSVYKVTSTTKENTSMPPASQWAWAYSIAST